MFYIVEHDMKVHQIIDTKGKPNKYGRPLLFRSAADALIWLSRHYKNGSYVSGNSIFGINSNPLYEVKEATPEELKQWGDIMSAHIFLKNKTEDGDLQEIEILGVDYIKMDEFYLSIYGTLTGDREHEIMGNLIGLFLSCEVIGYYMEDL